MHKLLFFLLITAAISCQKNNDLLEEPLDAHTLIPLKSNLNISKYTEGDADYLVYTVAQLKDSLAAANPGEIVFIKGNVELKIETQILIKPGVILASDRNNNGSLGAKIYREEKIINKWIQIMGDDVEISGLRIEGPHSTTDLINETTGIRIEGFQNLDVNNCEISSFSSRAIYLLNSQGHIHNNYIHHNRMQGLGYGVVLGEDSNALIENNLFDFNRHDIAGSGHCAQSYEARFNIVLTSGTSHSFDMHGLWESPNSNSNCAGNLIYIHHNTFMGTNYNAIKIRGIPQNEAKIEKNMFYHTMLSDAIAQRDMGNLNIPYPFQNINLSGNTYYDSINGNNNKDVIVLTPSNELKKYIFDDDLFFYKTFPVVGHGFNFENYFVGNWTNNGTSDLITRDQNGNLFLYKYNGTSFYGQGNPITVGNDFSFENYFVGYWTGNGTSDLITRDQNGTLHLYKFNGNSFYGQGNPTAVGHGFNSLEYLVGNWTDNGTTDMITLQADGRLLLYKFNGISFYGQGNPKQVGSGFNNERYFVGNWTNNGTADLITLDQNGNLLLYQFNGTSFSSLGTVGNGFDYVDYCIGDFTGDGIDDLLTIDSENSIYLYPFENDTFYNNGGPIKIGHNLFFKEFLVGQWGN